MLLSLASTPVLADLLPRDDVDFGPNALTFDTRTGIAWLDVPFSAGLSYDQLAAAMQPGGKFQGFRYASAEEVLGLFSSAGIPDLPGFYSESQIGPEVSDFISLLGSTGSNYGHPGITGISGTATPLYAGHNAVSLTFLSYFDAPTYHVGAPPDTAIYADFYGAPTIGSWLIAVPEPSTSVLGTAGGLALLLLTIKGRLTRR